MKNGFSKSIQLEINKALGQLEFVNSSYELDLWKNARVKEAWKHDLCLMRQHNDLKAVALQLLSDDGHVVFELWVDFHGRPVGKLPVDSAKGVELPLLDPGSFSSKRLVVNRGDGDDQYRQKLKLNWGRAENRRRHRSRSFDSDHSRCITGGRLHARFSVTESAVQQLRITRTGSRGFHFGETVDDRFRDVYLHESHASDDVRFVPGSLVQALVVTTPLGLQGRDIRACA